MIQFALSWAFLALPLPWLVRRLAPPAPVDSGRALALPFLHELPPSATAAASGIDRPRRVLAWLAWLLLVAAAAQPQWVGEPVQLPVAGRDLMLAVDISGSMGQEDYLLSGRPVDRLAVVKSVAGEFIARREGDRLGLVLFGTRAYLQTPLTYDRATVRQMLDEAVIGLAGRDTAIGDAIAVAVKRLKEEVAENRVLILLTDGANTGGNIAPLDAARVAERAGVRIYTIGIGAGQVGRRTPFGMLARLASDLDPATLQAIATTTGGRFFEAGDSTQLAQVYTELDRLEPSERDSRSFRPLHALYLWPGAAALLLSIGLALSLIPRRAGVARVSGVGEGRV